jgi:hypothetical protein
MIRYARALLRVFPRRRRRLWRYVSPRRRGVGLAFLAVLVALTYVYWYLTNDHRIRNEASAYLRDLTGAIVSIEGAQFSFFDGIELRGVRVDIPGHTSEDPFFCAATVVLKHSPWKLLAARRVRPTEILCIKPELTVEYDPESGEWNTAKLLELAGRRRDPLGAGPAWGLPPIRVRQARLRSMEIQKGKRRCTYEEPLTMTMTPAGESYVITFESEREQGEPQIKGSVVLDVAKGEIGKITGSVPIRKFHEALPEKYNRWLTRYGISGDHVEVMRSPRPVAEGGTVFQVKLVDLGLKLPENEGGLELTNVNGELAFHEKYVQLHGISGKAPQGGDARFEIRRVRSGQSVQY